MDRVAVKLEQDLAPMDEGNGEEMEMRKVPQSGPDSGHAVTRC